MRFGLGEICIKPLYHDNRASKVQYPVLQSQTEPQVRVEVLGFLLWHIFLQTTRSAVNTHLHQQSVSNIIRAKGSTEVKGLIDLLGIL